jgi:hypothetical protein
LVTFFVLRSSRNRLTLAETGLVTLTITKIPEYFHDSSLPADLPTPAEAGASRRREPWRRQGRPPGMGHPNSTKYPNQKVFLVKIDTYIYSVPYVEDKDKIFLKTIIPNSKATKKYFGGKK